MARDSLLSYGGDRILWNNEVTSIIACRQSRQHSGVLRWQRININMGGRRSRRLHSCSEARELV